MRARLKIRLTTAVASIIGPSILYSSKILLTASISSPMVMMRRQTMETVDPIISDLCHPYVYSCEMPFFVKASATILRMKASKSDAKCAQSVAIAIEPA